MADVKITALTAISANPVNPATFPIPMVDLLDNTITASGTTKKVTVNQILGAGGTATLASATITGAATVGTTLGVTGNTTLSSNLAVRTNKLTVNSTGVGIGTTNAAAILDVVSSGTASTYTVSSVIRDDTYPASGYPTLELNGFIGGNDYRSGIGSIGGQQLAFYTPTTYGVAPTRRMVVDSSGNLALDNGNVVMTTSGKGIDFSATSSNGTSELLNDYEEGVWTIAINDQLGNSATVASQIARYVKIGRNVSVFGDFTLSAKGSAGGGSLVYLGALPFLPVSTCFEGGVVHRYDNTNLTTNGQINIMSAAGGNTVCLFPVSSATTGTSFLTFTQITNTTRFAFNFSYDV